jgi:two-component system sensor histidine kinase ChvG
MLREGRSYRWFSPKRYSPLTLRIIVIFIVPTAVFFIGFLHLNQYRDTILQSEIDALYRQGDTLARTIGQAEAEQSIRAQRRISELTLQRATQLIASIPDAQIRIFQPDGRLISDSAQSSRLSIPNIKVTLRPDMVEHGWPGWIRNQVVKLAQFLSPGDNYPLYREGPNLSASDFPPVLAALQGEPASLVMRNRQGTLILGVAVPIRHLRVVRGALLVTASGAEIERDIEDLQYAFFQIFAGIIILTILMGGYLSWSIVGPITKLARAANVVRQSSTQSLTLPELIGRRDEIGILARDLSEMTDELQARMEATASFAADVSHEIKNPLTSLRSAVETISRLDDRKQQKELMRIILDDVGRLDRLITDISAASRLDADLSQAEFEEVDLADLIRNFAESRRLTAEKDHNVTIEVVTPKDAVKAMVVVDRLAQVLDNLMSNAITFSPDGGCITVKLARKAGQAVITVTDGGPGIPSGKTATIFNRFYTERPTDEQFGRHSGLGLSISKQIIEAHGGSISAANVKDAEAKSGAVMTITLPL